VAEITSTYVLKQNIITAKGRLQGAKSDGLKGKQLKPFTVAVKNAEAALKVAENALKASQKK
jgi:hypothetical protein